ncbi:TlpA family protein disulfide reductase [Candidatus Uhrbacteria bacterium]|jgi:peroxiredoxin|nr:TlpA family protein disulfide reductase [Candidatus Uhrbacteria bacterium]
MNVRQPYKLYRILPLIVAFVFVGAGCAKPGTVGVDVGQIAQDFTLTSFDGETVSLSDFEGQSVFLDFWAAWCPFCIGEIPEIEAIHQSYGSDVVVIGIHRTATEPAERGEKFVNELGVTYLLLKDDLDEVYGAYSGGRPFMPLAILIDGDGVIVERFIGPKTSEQMHAAFETLMTK